MKRLRGCASVSSPARAGGGRTVPAAPSLSIGADDASRVASQRLDLPRGHIWVSPRSASPRPSSVRLRRRRSRAAAREAAVFVLDPHVALVQPAQPQWPKVDVPDPVRNLLQSHVLPDAHDGDDHPARVPANAAVAADVADLAADPILKRAQV